MFDICTLHTLFSRTKSNHGNHFPTASRSRKEADDFFRNQSSAGNSLRSHSKPIVGKVREFLTCIHSMKAFCFDTVENYVGNPANSMFRSMYLLLTCRCSLQFMQYARYTVHLFCLLPLIGMSRFLRYLYDSSNLKCKKVSM